MPSEDDSYPDDEEEGAESEWVWGWGEDWVP